jgi:glucose/mannose-6-phosphate isomerase
MAAEFDEPVLDDAGALVRGDPGAILRAVATSGAQVRAGRRAAAEAGVAGVAAEGRPRAVIPVGVGGSGICADVLAAVCGPGSPVPVLPTRGFTLPGWAGPMDLVLAISCSGTTEETLSAVDEAVRRGCRLASVGIAGTPLAELTEKGRGVHIAIDAGGRPPRANLWAQSVPLLVLADALGLAVAPADLLERVADQLDALALRCAPGVDTFENPAKSLAAELANALPVAWGNSEAGGLAAYRFACQLNENAKLPAVTGLLPEAVHNQIVTIDGPLAGGGSVAAEDFFRDRAEAPEGWSMRLVVFRDAEEHPGVAARREVAVQLAAERGVPASEVPGTGAHALERLAEMVAVGDFASVYVALGYGVDPAPIAAIDALKTRTAR